MKRKGQKPQTRQEKAEVLMDGLTTVIREAIEKYIPGSRFALITWHQKGDMVRMHGMRGSGANDPTALITVFQGALKIICQEYGYEVPTEQPETVPDLSKMH